MTDRQVTMFYTGQKSRCATVLLPPEKIYSDGRDDYVHCDYYGNTWKLTGDEGKDF